MRNRAPYAIGVIAVVVILGIGLIIGINSENQLLGARVPTLVADPNPVVRNQPYTLTGFNFQKYKAVRLYFSDDGFTTIVYPQRGGFKFLTNTQTTQSSFTISAYDASGGQTGGVLLAQATSGSK